MTVSKKRVSLREPEPDQIDILDIAHALARIPRFNGHTRDNYSVAQHSVFVSHLVKPDQALYGLLHDAHEAYLGDLLKPFLMEYPGLREAFLEARNRFDKVIFEKFRVVVEDEDDLAIADEQALATEARDLFRVNPVESWGLQLGPVRARVFPWDHRRARSEFMNRFRALTSDHE